MKRSKINAFIVDAIAFFEQSRFHLPPFAYWTPEDWGSKGEEVREIVDRQLGWDITEYGEGRFKQLGLLLFTLRNGLMADLQKGQGKLYAEKIMIVGVDQITPMHFHWDKTEDIINRGGGKLVIQLYNADEDDRLDASDVTVNVDGVIWRVKAGDSVVLNPGESITLPPRLYHKFWAIGSRVLTGEVSTINDDKNDNRFYEPLDRFPTIEEDEPPLYLLVNDYSIYYRPYR